MKIVIRGESEKTVKLLAARDGKTIPEVIAEGLRLYEAKSRPMVFQSLATPQH